MELPMFIRTHPEPKKNFSKQILFCSIGMMIVGILPIFSIGKRPILDYIWIFCSFTLGIAGIFSYFQLKKNPNPGISFEAYQIKIQLSILNNKVIPTNDISRILFNRSGIILNLKNNNQAKILFSSFAFATVQELKDSFISYSLLNNIECITN